jgi:hypothetical protein
VVLGSLRRGAELARIQGGTMKRYAPIAALALALVSAAPLAAQPVVSEKKQIAIFSLGYFGWAIPQEALGGIDLEIQKVFTDMGRFEVLSIENRMSASGVDAFIATIKKSKESNFVMPEKFQFGEAIFTEAEFNKLIGAFIVAAPVVSSFISTYSNDSTSWETTIKTHVTFIDVAAGTTMAIAEVETSGSDSENQLESIQSAIESIPVQLEFEIRSIPAFQISTRVLAVDGKEIKLQLGKDMGLKKGDEYAIVTTESLEGIENETESGLVTIKQVDSKLSTGQIVYSSIKVAKDTQLREIPRMGTDLGLYFHLSGETPIVGLKGVMSRGFYAFKPYFAAQIPLSEISSYWGLFSVMPVNVIVGGEFNLYMGRLTVTPYAGAGASYARVLTPEEDEDTDWLSHLGFQAYLSASYLFSRDMKAYAEAGFDYWVSMDEYYFDSYGGLSFGAGIAFKL